MKAYADDFSGDPILEAEDGRKDRGSYRGIAVLEENGKTYIAVSSYFEGAIPPKWTYLPLQIIPVD